VVIRSPTSASRKQTAEVPGLVVVDIDPTVARRESGSIGAPAEFDAEQLLTGAVSGAAAAPNTRDII
jgi:hypothetical protein